MPEIEEHEVQVGPLHVTGAHGGRVARPSEWLGTPHEGRIEPRPEGDELLVQSPRVLLRPAMADLHDNVDGRRPTEASVDRGRPAPPDLEEVIPVGVLPASATGRLPQQTLQL